jgi:putative flavoprotein involved in K+ transport
MFTSVSPTGVVWADGQHEAVDSLIFATGFRPNVSFLDGLPVLDYDGHVLQRHGMALHVPGLYFVGLPRQRNFASATLRGVGPDAAHILPSLLHHLGLSTCPRAAAELG